MVYIEADKITGFKVRRRMTLVEAGITPTTTQEIMQILNGARAFVRDDSTPGEEWFTELVPEATYIIYAKQPITISDGFDINAEGVSDNSSGSGRILNIHSMFYKIDTPEKVSRIIPLNIGDKDSKVHAVITPRGAAGLEPLLQTPAANVEEQTYFRNMQTNTVELGFTPEIGDWFNILLG